MKTENEKWYCPVCKFEVVYEKHRNCQTLDEHVFNPNDEPSSKSTYHCSNQKCICNKQKVFWDCHGDIYGGFEIPDSTFINGNDSPFGSHSRKLNVEISRKGLKRSKYLSPWWTFKIWQPMIEYHYTSNTDGDVLSKRRSLIFLKKLNRKDKDYSAHVSFWHKTLRFLLKQAKKKYKNKDFDKLFKPSFNRAFPYRFAKYLIKVRYLISYIKFLKLKKINSSGFYQ